jgi:hypothetical protein
MSEPIREVDTNEALSGENVTPDFAKTAAELPNLSAESAAALERVFWELRIDPRSADA